MHLTTQVYCLAAGDDSVCEEKDIPGKGCSRNVGAMTIPILLLERDRELEPVQPRAL